MFYNALPPRSLVLTMLLALLILCGVGLRAAPISLTVATGIGTVSDGPAAAHYDFGVRGLSDETPLEHVFVLQNGTTAPIVVERLQSSCGCTTAVAGESNALPLTVAPGQTVPIHIQISRLRLLPGDMQKSVWVYMHGPGDATIRLEVRGIIQDDAPVVSPKAAPKASRSLSAPSFAQSDTSGRSFTLTAWRGHPVALFFFCGCPWCADVAQLWGHLQRTGALPPGTQTVIVFAGDKSAARAFAVINMLHMSRTVLLPDPNGRLTENLYKVSACPRVFALNPAGKICYTNNHPDDLARVAPAKVLVSRTLMFLRH